MFVKKNKLKFLFLIILSKNNESLGVFDFIKENPIKILSAVIATTVGIKVYQVHRDFEKDYLDAPENVKISWISEKANEFLGLFGLEGYEVEKVFGTLCRGEKSGNYRNEQYGRKLISEKISEKLIVESDNYVIKNKLKNEFLDNVSFEKLTVDGSNKATFELDVKKASEELINKLKEITDFSFTEKDKILSGNYQLSETIKGKKVYKLLIPNDGTRELSKGVSHQTKCPIMSWENDMLYRINITWKERLENDEAFRKNLSQSLYQFHNLLEKTSEYKNSILDKILQNDINYYNKHSSELSDFIKEVSNKQEENHQDHTVDEMSGLVHVIGDSLQDLISRNNNDENVLKHFTVPFTIQKIIAAFNYFNLFKYKLPNIEFNCPYISKNYWWVMDPNEQNQNSQIAIRMGHLENRYFYFTKQERDAAENKMLEVLGKFIDGKQFKYVKDNINKSEYSY